MKKHVKRLLFGVLLLGIGFGYLGFELTNYNVLSTLPTDQFEIKKEVYSYPINDIEKYHFYNYDGKTKVIIDEETTDSIRVEVSYAPEYQNMWYTTNDKDKNNKRIVYQFESIFSFKKVNKIFKSIVKNMEEKEIYAYDKLFVPTVKIYTNKENLKYIKCHDYEYIEGEE